MKHAHIDIDEIFQRKAGHLPDVLFPEPEDEAVGTLCSSPVIDSREAAIQAMEHLRTLAAHGVDDEPLRAALEKFFLTPLQRDVLRQAEKLNRMTPLEIAFALSVDPTYALFAYPV